jgi:hypothetical protein
MYDLIGKNDEIEKKLNVTIGQNIRLQHENEVMRKKIERWIELYYRGEYNEKYNKKDKK